MLNKTFVLDTNVLLKDKMAPLSFGEHGVAIPMTVLEELDNIKDRKNDSSFDARAAIRVIEAIIGDTNVDGGVPLRCDAFPNANEDARLYIIPDSSNNWGLGLDFSKPDNRIIGVAYDFGEEGVLVSDDVNMRIKANAAGVKAQRYENQIVLDDLDLLHSGKEKVDMKWLEQMTDQHNIIYKSCGECHIRIDSMDFEVFPGLWIHDDSTFAFRVKLIDEVEGELVAIGEMFQQDKLLKRRVSSISPRTLDQAFSINTLMDKNIDLVILLGAAGTGKTLMAMASACEMVKGKKRSEKTDIIFSRTLDSQFKDMGFLPGTEHEKLVPWLGAMYDNLEVIAKESRTEAYHPKKSVEDEKTSFISVKSMNFMRGRSLNDKVLIIDETQNMTASQIKTIITRAGENTKVILMGNLKQIDNPFISENNSGLTYAAEKFKNYPGAAVIHMEGIQRSPLAEFAEENL